MTIGEKFDIIKSDIKKFSEMSGRKSSDITVLAVTKTVSADRILEAVSLGITDIGENYVNELLEKHDKLKGRVEKIHFVGHLQTNKVKNIVDKVCLIHSVDRPSLLLEIDKRAGKIGKIQDILIEVNITGEESKSGVFLDGLTALIDTARALPNIFVRGLMTITPVYFSQDEAGEVYRRLSHISGEIKTGGNISMEYLSMGMSNDYTAAILEGSNMIRLGTAIFGKRI